MAATLSLVHKRVYPGGGVDIFFKVVLSGSYTTGGETLDFSSFHPVTGIPVFADINGKAGFMYSYAPGTTAANGKMMIFIEVAIGTNTPFVQHTAVAYVAAETGDSITGWASFK